MEDFLENITLLSHSLEKYKNNKDKLLSTFSILSPNNKEQLNIIVNKIDNINKKIYNISNDIVELQYEIDNNELDKSPEINNRIKDYRINKKIYDNFIPYLFLYSLVMNLIEE